MEDISIRFKETFFKGPERLFSAPGRIEIGGNHTDHQNGKVLAAAVSLSAFAAVSRGEEGLIRLVSQGYGETRIELSDLQPRPDERARFSSLVRGTAASVIKKCREKGGAPAPFGLDIFVSSQVPEGSGLSSSASFEVVLARAFDSMWELGLSDLDIALCCQKAENVYYGKPSGLMDQLTCAAGGSVCIDFKDPQKPVIRPVSLDPSAFGLSLILTDCGVSHADLTGEYASITGDLSRICASFGVKCLREVPEKMFMNELSALRRICGDRAVLRALHVYGENDRVEKQYKALQSGDMEGFLSLVRQSGLSSWRFLQNVTPAGDPASQDMAVALALAEKTLAGRGACRIQGGGFAGWLQSYVPEDMEKAFISSMEGFLGTGCCRKIELAGGQSA